MQEMKALINMRFGAGVWESIIAERARRIAEAKEAERLQRIEKKKAHDKFIHDLEIGSVVVIVLCGAIAALVFSIILL